MKIHIGAFFLSIVLAFGLGDITEPVDELLEPVEDVVDGIVGPLEEIVDDVVESVEDIVEPVQTEVDNIINTPNETTTSNDRPAQQATPEPIPTRQQVERERVVPARTQAPVAVENTTPDTEITTESSTDEDGNTETIIERTETETRFVDSIPYWIWIIIGAIVGVALSALYFMFQYRRKFDKLKRDIMEEFNINDLTTPS